MAEVAGGRRGKGVEIRRPREQNDKSQKKVELPHSLGRATMKNYPNSACFEKFLKEWKQHLPEANLARARAAAGYAESRSRSLEPRRAPHLPRPQSELEPRGLAIRDNELITKFSVLQGRSDAARLGTLWLVWAKTGEAGGGGERHTHQRASSLRRRCGLCPSNLNLLSRDGRPLQGCVCVGHRASVSLHIGRNNRSER